LLKPLEAVDHPRFQELIYMASRAPADSISIPDKRAIRSAILERFDKTVESLSEHLNVMHV
jgi:hypothetical protein